MALKRAIQGDGRVAVWIYAPGYIADDLSPQHMTDLTGFSFERGRTAWGPMLHITDFQQPISRGLPQDLIWGTSNRLGPVFHLADEEAQILGQVVYSQGRCSGWVRGEAFP